ncbi:ATP cone domain-containing protein, partial [Ralstonia sp.]
MTGTQVTRQVTKRDGSLAPFDAQKIRQAIAAAGQATGEFDTVEAQRLTTGVLEHLASLPSPGIEIIQNCV